MMFKRTYGQWGLKDGEGKRKIETCGGEQHRRPRLTKDCIARWWWWWWWCGYGTIISPVVLYGCEVWSCTLSEEGEGV
jgi:hypothetical protein